MKRGTYLDLPEHGILSKLNRGYTTFDILPYIVTIQNHPNGIAEGDLWFRRSILIHHNVENGYNMYICPTTIGKPCPVCDRAATLSKDDIAIRVLKPKMRDLFNVVVHPGTKYQQVLWDASNYLFGKVFDESLLENDINPSEFASLYKGYTIKVCCEDVSFTGGPSTRYVKATNFEFIKRPYTYPSSILESVVDLDQCLTVFSYEALENAFFGDKVNTSNRPVDARIATEEMINLGLFTRDMIIDALKENYPDVAMHTLRTYLADYKNHKFSPSCDKVAVEDSKGRLYFIPMSEQQRAERAYINDQKNERRRMRRRLASF